MPEDLVISDQRVSLDDLVAVARREKMVRLSDAPAWLGKIERGRRQLEEAAARGESIYGVNTGYGRTSRRQVPGASAELQVNLLRMHGCGLGPHLSEEEARAVAVARLVVLAKGYSGVRLALLESLARLVNSGIVAAIPSRGSVGASGDLTPLSYIGGLLAGERDALLDGEALPGAEALARSGLEPFRFAIKEGLALINGTSAMSAVGALAAARARRLIELAEQASALAIEVAGGRSSAMHPAIHRVKPHAGQVASAARILADLEGSGYARDGGAAADGRQVQDRYCLRCAPQLLGAARDALAWVEQALETEINGVSDNPLVDPDSGEIHNGGNFYGGHVALAMDLLKISAVTVINLMDRQFAYLVSDDNPHSTETLLPDEWLPAGEKGLHHGLKALQITVSSLAALGQQKVSPDSVLSRQTECDNQDVVSMGTNAAINAGSVLEIGEQVLACWMIALSQGAAVRGDDGLSPAGRRLVARVREVVPVVTRDRELDRDIERLRAELLQVFSVHVV